MNSAELFLPWPDKRLSPNARVQSKAWTTEEEDRLRQMHGVYSLAEIAAELGRSRPSIRARITVLGISKFPIWADWEVEQLAAAYASAGVDGVVDLNGVAERLGRHKSNVCRKARQLGLGTNKKRRTVEVRKDKRKYPTDAESRAATSRAAKARIAAKGHPKGMLGKKHTEEALRKISAASKATALMMTEERKAEIYMKAQKTKAAKGIGAPNIKRSSWQAGWREIGGKRNYYRSLWEANYARYLQWLKENGHIADWAHEPETFWFEAIKRGVRSYKPDFRVWENNGLSRLHEVKGWMDDRSRTCLARMKKYHPTEKIVLIDEHQYRAIRLKVMRLVPGWEDSARDQRS